MVSVKLSPDSNRDVIVRLEQEDETHVYSREEAKELKEELEELGL